MKRRFVHSSYLTSLALATLMAAGDAYAEELSIDSVKVDLVSDTSSESLVVINLNSEITDPSKVVVYPKDDNQNILLIEIPDAALKKGFGKGSIKGKLVSNIEAETKNDDGKNTTFITLTLSESADYKIAVNGKLVSITLMPGKKVDDPLGDALESASDDTTAQTYKLSGPQDLPPGPALTSLDFDQQTTISRIIIGTKLVTSYSDRQPRKNTILVDLPGAFVPRSLRRVLDTSKFFSPVKSVRAYRTSQGARIAVTLNNSGTYTIKKTTKGFLIIDIPVPEELQQERIAAAQSASVVSPGEPDKGISNAYQKEVLIGGKGTTHDPQAAFGSKGANDPASMLGMATGFMYDTGSATSGNFSGRRISLDFVNADIHSIFRLISHVSKLNIVTGDDVSGKITVRMQNVPWDQALAAILQAKGLGSQRFGNIIRVAPIDQIKSEQQSALEAKRAQEELTELKLLVIPLNYSKASELLNQVKALLSTRGSVQVDTRGNQLIIKETEDRLSQIRELVRHLDKPTPQVLIEARVVEASSSFTKNLGIQWGANVHANSRTGYPTGLFFPNSVGISGGVRTADGAEAFYSPTQGVAETLMVDMGAESSTSGMSISLGSIPGLVDIDARLSAMESDGWGKVVSEPRITTLDNQEAQISQGARVPYLSTSQGGTQVQFVEAALEMSVTPHITSDEQIFLTLKVSNNRPDFSQLVQGQPAIQIKEAQTSVLVADGDTTVIGGVFSSESAFSQDRVPGFSRIPLLGYLFKNSSDSLTRNELLVFITPHIVTRTAMKK